MSDKHFPEFLKNHLWYFDKDSFNVSSGSIGFTMRTITKTWRHVNSEGWEKYHNEMCLNCLLQFETVDELYLSVSPTYKSLSEKSKWTTAEFEAVLCQYKYHDFSIYENNEIMDDCY